MPWSVSPEDVSGEMGRTISDLVVSEHRLVRMSQAKRPGPPQHSENVSTHGALGRHSFLPQPGNTPQQNLYDGNKRVPPISFSSANFADDNDLSFVFACHFNCNTIYLSLVMEVLTQNLRCPGPFSLGNPRNSGFQDAVLEVLRPISLDCLEADGGANST